MFGFNRPDNDKGGDTEDEGSETNMDAVIDADVDRPELRFQMPVLEEVWTVMDLWWC